MDTSGFGLRPAGPADLEAVAELLRESRLPLDGLEDAFPAAIVATRGGRIVGCVALQLCGRAALLRSLAVSPDERGRGVGAALTMKALAAARTLGARDVYLLTETARDFFPRFGFAVEDRAGAPAAVQSSVEFRSACPASALMMRARVTS